MGAVLVQQKSTYLPSLDCCGNAKLHKINLRRRKALHRLMYSQFPTQPEYAFTI